MRLGDESLSPQILGQDRNLGRLLIFIPAMLGK